MLELVTLILMQYCKAQSGMAANKDGLIPFKHHQMGKVEITDIPIPTLSGAESSPPYFSDLNYPDREKESILIYLAIAALLLFAAHHPGAKARCIPAPSPSFSIIEGGYGQELLLLCSNMLCLIVEDHFFILQMPTVQAPTSC
jgi:hypothetical protein